MDSSSKYTPPHKRNGYHHGKRVWQPKKFPSPQETAISKQKIKSNDNPSLTYVFSDDGSIDFHDERSALPKALIKRSKYRGPSYARRQARRRELRAGAHESEDNFTRPEETVVKAEGKVAHSEAPRPVPPTEASCKGDGKLAVLFEITDLKEQEYKLRQKVSALEDHIETLKRVRLDVEQDVEFSTVKVNAFLKSLESGDWVQADMDKLLSRELRLLVKEYKEQGNKMSLQRILTVAGEAVKILAPLYGQRLLLQRDFARSAPAVRIFTTVARGVPFFGRFL